MNINIKKSYGGVLVIRKNVELKYISITPEITDDERKFRIEKFYNTLAAVYKIPNYCGCSYEKETKTIHTFVKK